MRSIRLGAVASFLAAVSLAASARADSSGTFQSYIGGPAVTVGNATYSNFTFDGGTVDASHILVSITSPSASVSEITFTAPPSGWTTALNALDDGSSQIEFDVAFSAPVSSVGLDFNATGSPNTVASVGETITDNLTSAQFSGQVITDGAGPLLDALSASIPVGSATSLHILKSIDIAGNAGPAAITSVDNTFSVPEPASLGILSIGVLLLARRRCLK